MAKKQHTMNLRPTGQGLGWVECKQDPDCRAYAVELNSEGEIIPGSKLPIREGDPEASHTFIHQPKGRRL